MKKIFLLLAVTPAYMMARAQFVTDYLKAADNYYKKGDYYSAAQYYEKYLNANPSKKSNKESYSPYAVKPATGNGGTAADNTQQVVYNLADSYRRLNYPAKAVAYYEKALTYDNARNPLAGYYYAVTLRELGKDEEAEKAFQLFLDKYRQDDVYSQSARVEVLNLHFIREQLKRPDLHLYTLEKQHKELNPTGANYSPVWLNSSTLLFTSTRPQAANENEKEKPFVNRVYQATFNGDSFSNVTRMNLPQPAGTHQGVVSLTPDGNTLFLTRWNIAANGKKTSAIYISKKTNDTAWSEPVLADSVINIPGANAQQPFVMPGGKYLLFASDKPGGMGGFDLWGAQLDETGKPVHSFNLGNTVNTASDEQAPYYHEPSSTLVFSCNGRTGMGGFDFFYSTGNINSFTTPVNFGYPVNSVKDDIYFTSRGTANNILADVLISSDRSAECCLELFALKKRKPWKQISGVVVACKDQSLLQGVSIHIIDTINNKTVYTATTAADGSYAFSIEEYQPLKAVATLSGYNDGALQFNTPVEGAEKDSLLNPAICLGKDVPAVEEVVVIDNVYYDFDQFTLRSDSYVSLDKIVAMLNKYPGMEIEIRAHTDSKGTDEYNTKLSEARAKSVVAYLVSKGIDKARLQAKGYGATMPVASNQNEDGSDNPEGRQANRRTEFKVLKK
jgi:outer membrane protein OmpA-like peptidoglycan-associated protein